MEREQIETILSPYYGALTQTAIDHITDKLTQGLSVERQRNSRDDGWQRRWVGPWVPEDDPYQGVSVADE